MGGPEIEFLRCTLLVSFRNKKVGRFCHLQISMASLNLHNNHRTVLARCPFVASIYSRAGTGSHFFIEANYGRGVTFAKKKL